MKQQKQFIVCVVDTKTKKEILREIPVPKIYEDDPEDYLVGPNGVIWTEYGYNPAKHVAEVFDKEN